MSGRPNKVSISPMQREILLLLEEAGEETIVTVMATLHQHSQTRSPSELLAETDQAVNGLKALRLLDFTKWDDKLHRSTIIPEFQGQHWTPLNLFVEYSAGGQGWEPSSSEYQEVSLTLTEEGRRFIFT